MSEYMSIFQVGPVLDFIQTARKTQDYWSGSFLLSYLNARAIHTFNDQEVIFPHVIDCKLYEAAKNAIPWPQSLPNESYRSSLPNRFFAITDYKPDNCLKESKKAVENAFGNIASIVYDEIERKTKNALSVNAQTAIWNDQIESRSFEILYVWREKPDTESHDQAYARTEALLGSRKSTRLFEYTGEQKGYACSLCGLRAAMGSSQCVTRKNMRDWWQDNMKKNRAFPYKFREGEYLCAVCTVKRLAPEIVFKSELDIPSTSVMSAAGFLKDVHKLLSDPKTKSQVSCEISNQFDNFQNCAKTAAKAIVEPQKTKWPGFFSSKPDIHPEVDGDWYYVPFYEHQSRLLSSKKDVTEESLKRMKHAKEAWEALWKKTREEKPDILPPSRYFALLSADGDSMGSILQNIKNKEHHKLLSQTLIEFSAKHVPNIIEELFPGFVLYWGGDEGVAMVCLEDLFNVMNNLHEAWRDFVEFPLQKIGIDNATLSVGAVIIHHQYPLRSAIAEVRQAIETAKAVVSYGRKKDAWAVRILRRSGAPVTAGAHWCYDTYQPLLHLENFQQAYRKSWLSPKWITDLYAEEPALGDPKPDAAPNIKRNQWENSRYLYGHESKRLIERHTSKGDGDEKIQHMKQLIADHGILNEKISGHFSHVNYQRFQDIMVMMDLAQYVAKGGGR